MYRTASLFLLIAVSAACGAEGVVVDPSGRPVPRARVTCADISIRTGEDGRFALPSGTHCRAVIMANGFAPREIDIFSDEPLRVELAIAPLADRVVVSATRRETTPEEAGVSATVVTLADLEAREFPAVADVLRETPGIQVSRYGRPGSLTQIYGRGGQRTGMLVLIDGVPVNDPGGEVNLAGFSTTGLERMEVVRGPESALFGADASSGVIQLFTKRGSPEDRLPRGSVSYERGSFQTDRWMANLAGGSGSRFDYSLGAEQFHTVGEYVNDYFRNTTGTANLGFRIRPATQVRGVFRTFDSMAGTPNQVGYGIYDLDANEATRDTLVSAALDDTRGRNYVQRISFGYHRSHDLFLNPTGESYDLAALMRDVGSPVRRTYFEGLANPTAPVPAGLRLVTVPGYYLFPSDPYLSLSSRKDAEYQGTLTHRGGAVVFGYAYERQDADISSKPYNRDNHGFYAHEQYSFAGRASLSAGLRVERNSAFGTKVTPRGAASYLLTGEHGALSSTYVRASAGIGIVEPSLLQNFSREYYATGNPDLRPEKTTSYEAGIVQEWFSRRLRTEVAAFDNSYKDLIVFVSTTWKNVEASRARGLEFSSDMKLAGWLTASGTYTRMWTRITRSNTPDSIFFGVGEELTRRPGNSGSASVTLTPRRWTFHAGAVFVGERQDPDQFVFGVSRNRGYQSVYAAGSLRLSRHVTPFLRAGNVLNQHYQEVLGYPAASRNVHGGVRLEW